MPSPRLLRYGDVLGPRVLTVSYTSPDPTTTFLWNVSRYG